MKIISAYYFASAGGMTSNSVWGTHLPYLRSVPSFDDGVKKFEALKEDIRNAKSFIHLQYYIIKKDVFKHLSFLRRIRPCLF